MNQWKFETKLDEEQFGRFTTEYDLELDENEQVTEVWWAVDIPTGLKRIIVGLYNTTDKYWWDYLPAFETEEDQKRINYIIKGE